MVKMTPLSPPRSGLAGPVAAAAGALLLVWVGLTVGGDPPALDAWGLDALRAAPEGPAAPVVAVVSDGLRAGAVAGAIAALGLLLWRERGAAVRPALGHTALFLLLAGSSEALKAAFARPHPLDPGDVSFPSTHVAMVTVAALIAAGVGGRLAPRWRGPLVVGAALAVVATAASRVLLGEHYLTDVVVSAAGYVGLTVAGLVMLAPRSPAARREPEAGAETAPPRT